MKSNSSERGESTSSTKTGQIKSKLLIVLWITLFWLFLGLYQYFDRTSVLDSRGHLPNDYSHWPYVQGIVFLTFLGGAILGPALVFVWEKWLRDMAFWRALTAMALYYTGFYVLLTFVAILALPQNDPLPIKSENLGGELLSRAFDINLLPNFVFWLFIMLLSMSFLLMRDKFGPGMFLAFFRGKYFRPKREERIFMFMDLQSSTTIAEQLGEETYFNFLNDAFKTATPGILATQGEIYQYVGDEIVVSWPQADGLRDANCIRCFYSMTELLVDNSDHFQETYGVQPRFKAGLHSGYVIAGEMGVIKREIVYTGDVLNTTARIQSKCNEFDVFILLSESLMGQLDLSGLHREVISLGEVDLRGKMEKVGVVTLQ